MNKQSLHSEYSHASAVERYYRYQSAVYDVSRWAFLFGRNKIFELIPALPSRPHILEVGCGTGKNIERMLRYYPGAKIVGVDLSPHMLNIARDKVGDDSRVELFRSRYGSEVPEAAPFDLILCSYSLTMMDHDPDHLMDCLKRDLNPEAPLAVVDFHTSSLGWFRRWMKLNHVDFSGNILPRLGQHFSVHRKRVSRAYLGWWSYFMYVGRRS